MKTFQCPVSSLFFVSSSLLTWVEHMGSGIEPFEAENTSVGFAAVGSFIAIACTDFNFDFNVSPSIIQTKLIYSIIPVQILLYSQSLLTESHLLRTLPIALFILQRHVDCHTSNVDDQTSQSYSMPHNGNDIILKSMNLHQYLCDGKTSFQLAGSRCDSCSTYETIAPFSILACGCCRWSTINIEPYHVPQYTGNIHP